MFLLWEWGVFRVVGFGLGYSVVGSWRIVDNFFLEVVG